MIDNNYGLRWLQSLAIIWVGGASIPTDLAEKARKKSINLAPCYGATETAAMVTCLSPRDFLNGSNSVGFPLEDVAIEINKRNLLKIKTNRIAISKWQKNKLEPITNSNGWWESGDLAQYVALKNKKALDIHKLMKHTESEKIQCRKCPGRVFKNEATLKVHLAGHKGFKKGAA